MTNQQQGHVWHFKSCPMRAWAGHVVGTCSGWQLAPKFWQAGHSKPCHRVDYMPAKISVCALHYFPLDWRISRILVFLLCSRVLALCFSYWTACSERVWTLEGNLGSLQEDPSPGTPVIKPLQTHCMHTEASEALIVGIKPCKNPQVFPE